jgi:pimeloyl-ACP methyl ester carboxylesterase
MIETIRVGDLTVVSATPDTPAASRRPPLLLVHGFMVGAWWFERFQTMLAARGWPSWAVNLRGHDGRRWEGALGRVSVADYASDALVAARALAERHGVARPIVLGHSMGGLVAQKVAETGMASAAVLLCPAPPRGLYFVTPKMLLGEIPHLWPTIRRRPIAPRSAEFAYMNFNRIPRGEWDGLFARTVADSSTAGRELLFSRVAVDASRVRCPVLVGAASDDRFFPPAVERRVAARYGAELMEFGGHAHFILFEPGWEAVAARIEGWLARTADALAPADLPARAATVMARGAAD